MSEETTEAQKSVPQGILYTCVMTAISGFVYLMILLFSTANQVDDFVTNKMDVPALFAQCMTSQGAMGLTAILLINFFFSGMASETVTVRIAFALARDGAMPFSAQLKVC
jgi:amino acid transporter